MDLKDGSKTDRPPIFPENSQSPHRFINPNTGQLYGNKVNHFNPSASYTVSVNNYPNHINTNDDEFINLYDNNFVEEPSVITSKEFLDELMKNYPIDGDIFVNEQYDELNEACIADAQNQFKQVKREYSQSNLNFSPNACESQFVGCSKPLPKVMRLDPQIRFEEIKAKARRTRYHSNETITDPTTEERLKAEKTTYCRPTINMYNHEYVYKTMQRNAKLHKMIRKLAIEREREKQREAWNNYINELKNKHKYYSNEPSRISPQYVPGEHNPDELINDFYNVKYELNPTFPCPQLFQDFYDIHGNMPPDAYKRFQSEQQEKPIPQSRSFPYESNPYCFPTSSQANLLRKYREKQGNRFQHDMWRHKPDGRYFRGHTIVAERERRIPFETVQGVQGANMPFVNVLNPNPDAPFNDNKNNLTASESKPIQTEDNETLAFAFEVNKQFEINNLQDQDLEVENKLNIFDEKIKKVTNNIANLKNKIKLAEELVDRPHNKQTVTPEDLRCKSLANIEEKIDCLLKSINSIMVDIKSRKSVYGHPKSASVSCKFITSHNKLKGNKSDPYGLIKSEEIVCNMVHSNSTSVTISEVCSGGKFNKKRAETSISGVDKILLEELKKSDQVKKDIENILNLRNNGGCSVQITFDIPTKEISTEVTKSLSKTGKFEDGSQVIVKEVPMENRVAGKHSQMTIAVNTDPLGLLALLRVSTETVKQLLSYVPNLNYHSYLSMLPRTNPKACVSHYICNICGAAFGRPSQLSDHIEQHSLGRTRDCCVCRHTLDTRQNSRLNLFACRYCGQRFTRAYCCELHQRTCARRLGCCHDVNSSHILLR